jgi:hypothetical protein
MALEKSPQKSMRRLSAETNISETSCRKIAKKVLHMFPYKISVLQELKPGDAEKRVKFAEWMLELVNSDASVLDYTFFSDEAHFHLSGYVNNQNYRFLATEKPDFSVQAPLYPQRITVWAAMSRKHLIGPIFITETVTADVYLDVLRTKFFPALLQRRMMTKTWFQQDGATPHTANRVMQKLKEKFGTKVISKGLWPPRSPDLSPCDFFLWGFLKDRVYTHHPKNIEELRFLIEEKFLSVDMNMLQNVSENFLSRLHLCIDMNGGHFE